MLFSFIGGDRIDYWVKVEGGNIWIILFDIDAGWKMIGRECNFSWSGVVEMWEGDFIFCSNLLSNDDFIDVVEFIPVFILFEDISE